jgi:hypothetical protein
MGINTEDSPLAQDPSFAEIADNAVIDKRGRIAARKGNDIITLDPTILDGDYIHQVHYFFDDEGNSEVFSVGNLKIFSGTETLVDITPSGYNVGGNNWKMVNFNDACYFVQKGQEPLIYTDAGGLQTFGDYTGQTTDLRYYCNEALAAYGRLWLVDNAGDSQTIYFSDLLIGTSFTQGSSGSLEISKAWPDGFDQVRALAAHNGFLIIFGEHSIIVFGGAESPASMAIQDTVSGVGCVCRNSVQYTGTDVIFLASSGLKSFQRTVQEKSMPIGDLSLNIRTEFVESNNVRTGPTISVYSPENSFYIIGFPGQDVVYCFNLQGALENGAYRVTRWPSVPFTAGCRTTDGTLYIGSPRGIGEYKGYSDAGASYRFRYYSPGLTFGDPSQLKILKKLRPTLVGANSATVFIKWAYDFNTNYKTATFTVGNQTPAYFSNPVDDAGVPISGVSEYVGYSELAGLGITSTWDGTKFVINKYLGEFPTYDSGGSIVDPAPPTTGVGGGALADGDSYFNVANDIYYVYLSSEWRDASTLTTSSSSEYTGGEVVTRRPVNTTGDGTIITIGLESDINGFPLSLQEINVLALKGKIL